MRQRKAPTADNPYVTFAVALNFFDPDQQKMIHHISKRTNFSEYFKRLVLRDMDGILIAQTPTRSDTRQEVPQIDSSLMRGLT